MKLLQVTLLLICGVATVYLVPLRDEVTPRDGETCGYESCHISQDGFLNVHIVPHTHDDVGWLKTVDQYYYGSRNFIQKAGVQYILDSVIKELWDDEKRRFIYVETAFFWKWWVRQPESVQQKVHTLVRQGRLQMVGGAWSMNDEAASHYQSTVDQFTWGLSKLNKTFGSCGRPRVGWQIDPFGHSREFASLLSMMGYDGLFLGRIDYQDKLNRLNKRSMEMVWRGSDELGKASDIFTGVLHNTYSPPPGFCFDVLCSDEPIVDDPDSPMYNVENKIAVFLDFVKTQAKYYRTKNVILTMGGDFTYQDAHMWYVNLDKLITYANLKAAKEGYNITLFYSTPDCYLKAIKDSNDCHHSSDLHNTLQSDTIFGPDLRLHVTTKKHLLSWCIDCPVNKNGSKVNCPGPTLPTKQDDFFPYASDSTAYWTGYFTSRPTTKYFEREANNYLQMVKQLQVLADLEEHNQFVLNELRSAMGVMQHHDAITGTEKQHVTHDYERLLNQAIDDALIIARQAFNKETQKDPLKPPIFDFQRCHLNESRCDVSESSEKFVVTIYNPLGWSVKEPIRIPVVDGTYEVYGPDGKQIKTQMVTLPYKVTKIPTRTSKAVQEIVFIIDLKPLSYKSIYVKKIPRTKRDTKDNYNLYNTNINEYFENIKKYDENIKNDDAFNQIPMAPIHSPETEIKDIDLEILKDGSNNEQIEDLERLLRDGNQRKDRSWDKIKNSYPDLNEEEMRMLSDDPKTVERFEDNVVLSNQFYKLEVDTASGQTKQVTFPDHSTLNFSVNMYYYTGSCGDNHAPDRRASGAYIFRPINTTPTKLSPQKTKIIDGDIVKEFRVNLTPNAFINTKLYNGLDFIETEWIVGPIPIADDTGKEYVIKYETNILNNGEFYTDSNGRQMLKRKLDFRPQWNVSLAEPVAGNYYPVTNEIFIKSDGRKMNVLTDRSEGGTSLVEGEIELMLHRRLLCDDAFGVGEALNETANNQGLVVRGKHRILINKNDDFIKRNVFNLHLSPHVLISDASNIKYDEWLKLNNELSWMEQELPKGVHLLTLEPWDTKILLRLENYLDKTKNSNVVVDLKSLFKNIDVKSVKETLLAANMWKDEYEKWVWKTNHKMADESTDSEIVVDDFKVTLKAKEIRTFIIDYDIKNS